MLPCRQLPQVICGAAVLQHGQEPWGEALSKGMVPSVLSRITGPFGRWSFLCLQMLLRPLPCTGRWSTGWLREHLPWPPPFPHELQTSAWPLDVPDSNTSLTDDSSWEGFWFLSEAELAQGSSWQLNAFVSTRRSGAECLCCMERLAVRAVPAPCNTAWTRPLLLCSSVPGKEMLSGTVLLPSLEPRPEGSEKLISAHAIASCRALAVSKRTRRSR